MWFFVDFMPHLCVCNYTHYDWAGQPSWSEVMWGSARLHVSSQTEEITQRCWDAKVSSVLGRNRFILVTFLWNSTKCSYRFNCSFVSLWESIFSFSTIALDINNSKKCLVWDTNILISNGEIHSSSTLILKDIGRKYLKAVKRLD